MEKRARKGRLARRRKRPNAAKYARKKWPNPHEYAGKLRGTKNYKRACGQEADKSHKRARTRGGQLADSREFRERVSSSEGKPCKERTYQDRRRKSLCLQCVSGQGADKNRTKRQGGGNHRTAPYRGCRLSALGHEKYGRIKNASGDIFTDVSPRGRRLHSVRSIVTFRPWATFTLTLGAVA